MNTGIEFLLSKVSEVQSADGAFSSTVHWGTKRHQDWNGFTTALVLRALHALPACDALRGIRERALGFLLKCAATDPPGAFSFWPAGAQPRWIPETLPPDADDTAVYAVELARHGCLDQRAMRRIACLALVPFRLREIDQPAPTWLRPGVFFTWLRREDRANVVDCCANANVVAFLAYSGQPHMPGYREACSMIEDAIRWAGDSRVRARSLSPFYAHPVELLYAVEHAVQCGAESLRPSLSLLRDRQWAREDGADEAEVVDLDRPICSNAYGGVFWTSRALQMARTLGCRSESVAIREGKENCKMET